MKAQIRCIDKVFPHKESNKSFTTKDFANMDELKAYLIECQEKDYAEGEKATITSMHTKNGNTVFVAETNCDFSYVAAIKGIHNRAADR